MPQVYAKEITASDAGDRLYVSIKCLDNRFFELPDGESSGEVVAYDAKGELRPWRFGLRIRKKGRNREYREAVISRGWRKFVREKKVKASDTVVFFKEYYHDQDTGREMPRYKIGLGRELQLLKLFGVWLSVVVR